MVDLSGQHFGQYEITELIGQGGMATVYRARQASMRRNVAIKVIETRLAGQGEFLKRFEREAQTVASLSHAHIIKVFDYGQQDDIVYLVMELLVGGSLAGLIRGGPLSAERISRLLDQMASALDYAHRRGVIHRDLKPQNVLLDEDGNAFLTDFGIAKLLSEASTLTQSGTAIGTPAYMPPEQWSGQPIDARSDVYALGIILFEMLTGTLPFSADTPATMMYKHLQEQPPSIHDLQPGLSPAVDRVIARALAKDRSQRFASAGELATAFKAALSDIALPVTEEHRKRNQATLVESVAPQPKGPGRRLLVLVGVLVALGLIAVLASVLLRGPAQVAIAPTPIPTTRVPPTATRLPPTLTNAPPTPTRVPPSPTPIPPTATRLPPTLTKAPPKAPTATRVPLTFTPNAQVLAAQVGCESTADAYRCNANQFQLITWKIITNDAQYAVIGGAQVNQNTHYNVVVGPNHTSTYTVNHGFAFVGPQEAVREEYCAARQRNPTNTFVNPFNWTCDATPETSVKGPIPLIGHTARVTNVAFSPNGRYVATSGADGTAFIWEIPTGKKIQTLPFFTGTPLSAAFSPDGNHVIIGLADGRAFLRDVKTGDPVQTFGDHKGGITALAFSPDGKYALTGSADGSAQFWEVRTGSKRYSLYFFTGAVLTAAFSPDGKYMLVGTEGGTASFRDVDSGKLIYDFVGHNGSIVSTAFSPNGKYAMTGGADGTARLWDTEKGSTQYTLYSYVSGAVVAVAFSPDGQYVLLGFASGFASLRKASTGDPVRNFTSTGEHVTLMAFSPDGKHAISARANKAWLWEVGISP